MDHSFLPARSILRALRVSGVVPWSSATTRALVLTALFGLLPWCVNHFGGVADVSKRIVEIAQMNLDDDQPFRVCVGFAAFVLISSGLVIVIGVLASIIQSGAIFSRAAFGTSYLRIGEVRNIARLWFVVIGTAVGTFLLYRYGPEMFLLMRRSGQNLAVAVLTLGLGIAKAVAVIGFVLAILWYLNERRGVIKSFRGGGLDMDFG